MTKWKVSCPCLEYITVAETAEEAKKIAKEQIPWFSDPGVDVTVERCPDKVYIVWVLIDGTMHEDDRQYIDKIFSTRNAAEKYVNEKSEIIKYHISEVEVEE